MGSPSGKGGQASTRARQAPHYLQRNLSSPTHPRRNAVPLGLLQGSLWDLLRGQGQGLLLLGWDVVRLCVVLVVFGWVFAVPERGGE